ncbi:MAG: hypothetical protein JRJ09_05295 [Deltaproteobacteria bacterium]|nr:hypothetical protein [Deltaproteobacteria bacterium]MBW2047930.1 hypothetical protein [Deltaproteobacteria bacterium]MBW2112330.1 hypothetical protein [Deltaproteobacteria bacterium]MBW2352976.1 hypothetical protein [Deltaproteobacteria bacterium]
MKIIFAFQILFRGGEARTFSKPDSGQLRNKYILRGDEQDENKTIA